MTEGRVALRLLIVKALLTLRRLHVFVNVQPWESL